MYIYIYLHDVGLDGDYVAGGSLGRLGIESFGAAGLGFGSLGFGNLDIRNLGLRS